MAISGTFPAISHVAVTVTDLSVSEAWYTRLFGAGPVLDEDTGPFRHIVYALGNTLFGLHGFPRPGQHRSRTVRAAGLTGERPRPDGSLPSGQVAGDRAQRAAAPLGVQRLTGPLELPGGPLQPGPRRPGITGSRCSRRPGASASTFTTAAARRRFQLNSATGAPPTVTANRPSSVTRISAIAMPAAAVPSGPLARREQQVLPLHHGAP